MATTHHSVEQTPCYYFKKVLSGTACCLVAHHSHLTWQRAQAERCRVTTAEPRTELHNSWWTFWKNYVHTVLCNKYSTH